MDSGRGLVYKMDHTGEIVQTECGRNEKQLTILQVWGNKTWMNKHRAKNEAIS